VGVLEAEETRVIHVEGVGVAVERLLASVETVAAVMGAEVDAVAGQVAVERLHAVAAAEASIRSAHLTCSEL
jgi:hypothetical protein